MRRVLVIGGNGQLGRTLRANIDNSLHADLSVAFIDIDEIDLGNESTVPAVLDSQAPQVIINAAAYTAVDQAESDANRAMAINAAGPAHLADWAAANQCRLIQISTDFVFDGSQDRPILPDSPTAPLSVYGRSKLAGEAAVQRKLPEAGLIVRTSWLYSECGNNFVLTMLRLMRERDELAVVNDQIGSPTSTHSLACALLVIAGSDISGGIYHYTDGGAISWYDFALAIQQEGLRQSLLDREIPVRPITTAQYPTPARRPAYSVLDRQATLQAFGLPATDWRQELQQVIAKIRKQEAMQQQ